MCAPGMIGASIASKDRHETYPRSLCWRSIIEAEINDTFVIVLVIVTYALTSNWLGQARFARRAALLDKRIETLRSAADLDSRPELRDTIIAVRVVANRPYLLFEGVVLQGGPAVSPRKAFREAERELATAWDEVMPGHYEEVGHWRLGYVISAGASLGVVCLAALLGLRGLELVTVISMMTLVSLWTVEL